MDWIFNSEIWISLLTLTILEIILGIDNIIFLAIMVGKLPPAQQAKARQIGLFLAMFMRVALLLSLTWIMQLTEPFITIFQHGISGRDLILLGGGIFLIGKSTMEIHEKLEGGGEKVSEGGSNAPSFMGAIIQIVILDIVFSLDSVITAVGTASHVEVMIAAVVIAIFVMMIFSKAIGDFVLSHPTVKMLALSFLILIGVTLIAEGMGQHISKEYIYFAMAFSLGVEMLNLRLRRPAPPVVLHDPYHKP